jgi:hypothetical protein
MDSAVKIAFITAGVAFITCIMNMIVIFINSKKSGNLKIIVETRIKYMQSLREANAIFIGCSNPDVILQCAKIINGMYVYPKELAEAAGLLKTLLKPFYRIENKLIEKINSIEQKCLDLYINGATYNLIETIKTERADYIKLFAQYDWAYWQFIMKQADSKYKYSSQSFDDVYEETRRDIVDYAKVEKFVYDWIDE